MHTIPHGNLDCPASLFRIRPTLSQISNRHQQEGHIYLDLWSVECPLIARIDMSDLPLTVTAAASASAIATVGQQGFWILGFGPGKGWCRTIRGQVADASMTEHVQGVARRDYHSTAMDI